MLNLPKIIRSKLMIVALGFVIIEIATAAVPEVKKVSPGKNKKGPDKNVVLSADPDASKVEYFEKNVRPILVNHCYACHSADTKPSGDLRVDDRKGLIVGGKNGPAIVAGKPDQGLLLKRVSSGANKQMPLQGEKLNDTQISSLKKWIEDGAVWPAVKLPFALGQSRPTYEKLKKEHWAWQPIANPKVPEVKDASWSKSSVDRFVFSKMDAAGLQPVADADRVSLIRRLTFDLTGLPPTPAEIQSFVNDTNPNALENLVDRLLAAKAFGESWGRHWLDIARYGESTGPSRNIPYPHAWRYRDYVIDSFNADLPFNQFIKEQVAGDLLSPKNDEDSNRLKIATGFLALGVKDVNQRFKTRFIMDNVDEQIDVVTRSVLGLTVSCARCHDHKFDPIPQTDYYSLAGIFTSTDNASGLRNLMGGGGLAYYVPDNLVKLKGAVSQVPDEKRIKLQAEIEDAKKAWEEIKGTPKGLKPDANGEPEQKKFRVKLEKLQSDLSALMDSAQESLSAHGVRDSNVIADTEVRIRGEAEKLGPVWPRGYLTAFHVPDAKPVNKQQSGRLELAQWLTSEQNPLASRVIVNRVWAHLFGRGIVSTVDNFGVSGDKPSNPELLDYLSRQFMQDGWSIKKLVRTLVLTKAYQLSSQSTDKHHQVDPANSLVWHHSPRSLSAEEFRDAMLATGGQLNSKRISGSPTNNFKMKEIRDNGGEAKQIHDSAAKSSYRSIYLPLLRGLTPKDLEAFDPVDQTLVTGNRDSTTVPGQALFVLNSSFVRRQSLVLAEKLLQNSNSSDDEKIKQAYQLMLGRIPNEKELERGNTFLADYESAARELKYPPKPNMKKPVQAKQNAKKKNAPPANPDQIEQEGELSNDEEVLPKDGKTAAWLALVQALYASAEFRFIK